jgi:hypothetical protein
MRNSCSDSASSKFSSATRRRLTANGTLLMTYLNGTLLMTYLNGTLLMTYLIGRERFSVVDAFSEVAGPDHWLWSRFSIDVGVLAEYVGLYVEFLRLPDAWVWFHTETEAYLINEDHAEERPIDFGLQMDSRRQDQRGVPAVRNLVGLPGFEPGTSCTPSKRASQAAPQPETPSVAHALILARSSTLISCACDPLRW